MAERPQTTRCDNCGCVTVGEPHETCIAKYPGDQSWAAHVICVPCGGRPRTTPAMRNAITTRARRIRTIHAGLADWPADDPDGAVAMTAAMAGTTTEEVARVLLGVAGEPESET